MPVSNLVPRELTMPGLYLIVAILIIFVLATILWRLWVAYDEAYVVYVELEDQYTRVMQQSVEHSGKLHHLKAAIRKHRDARGHDRCRHNDTDLYLTALPDEGIPSELFNLPNIYDWISKCGEYHQQQNCQGGCHWVPLPTVPEEASDEPAPRVG